MTDQLDDQTDQAIGFLYVITHKNASGMVKIGITQRPEARMRELDVETIWARVLCFSPRLNEQALHKQFANKRLPGTEWFQISPDTTEFKSLLEKVNDIGSTALSLITLDKGLNVLDQLQNLELLKTASQDNAELKDKLSQLSEQICNEQRQHERDCQLLRNQVEELKHKFNHKTENEVKYWRDQYELERGKRLYYESMISDFKLHIKALEGRLDSLTD